MNEAKIVDTNASTISNFAMCGYKHSKQIGYQRKVEWNKKHFELGLKYKVLLAGNGEAVGAIEYIPGEYSWRPVNADHYLFIHCIYIMKKSYKEKGYGQKLLDSCIEDAQKQKKQGVAVIVRKGSWMANKSLFIKNGFTVVAQSAPDFELLALRFNDTDLLPAFKEHEFGNNVNDKGLVIYYSDQCPYLAKAVHDISEAAIDIFGIKASLVYMNSHIKAQKSACAFGTFCITFSGKVIADHPVSSTRFKNIMNKILNE